MANSTFIQVPANIADIATLRRFLEKLILQLDIAFGNRGNNAFVTTTILDNSAASLQDVIDQISQAVSNYSKLDGSRDYTGIVKYDTDFVLTNDFSLTHKKFVDDNFEPIIATKGSAFNVNFGTTSGTATEGGTTTNNPKQTAIANLSQTISTTYSQAQVQAISSKVDSLLAALRLANILAD